MENSPVYVYSGNDIISQEDVNLAIGESQEITREINLKDRFVSTTDNEGNITESLEIKASTIDDSFYRTVVRTATAVDIELIQLISDISFKDSSLSIKRGSEKTLIINKDDAYSLGGEAWSVDRLFDVVWKSSDENVARVFDDGNIVAYNKGSVVISAYI